MNGTATDLLAGTPIRLRRYVWALAGCWSVTIAVVLTWRLSDAGNQAVATARSEAAGAWKKEAAIIDWAAASGLVYVPVTDKTSPDPHLSFLPERDVSTTSGRKLTAISPPMIVDQIHAMAGGQAGFRDHICALKPVRPENAPSPWEKRTLERFTGGVSEASNEETIQGRTYLQLIRPLLIKSSCLRCHAEEGYKVGDIRGGLTISVPMELVRITQREQTVGRIFGYGGVWVLGMCGIALTSRRLRQQVLHRYDAEQRLREAHGMLEKRVAERTAELADVNRQLQDEIVDRKQAEEWLLESEQRFRGYFEQGLVGMAILSAEKEWVEFNKRLCQMLGYTEAELLLKPLEQLIDAEDRPAAERHFQQLLDGVTHGFAVDARLVRKDGRVFPAGVSAQCLKKSDGATDCLLLLVQDMSDRQLA